ncbi:adrenodoxin-like [Ambystoma mexicanum]|uniref:adrenodoxin-like n=1 Tax=Ambystoma mexicanum TaxID=8296 RepID=UPI0037E97150
MMSRRIPGMLRPLLSGLGTGRGRCRQPLAAAGQTPAASNTARRELCCTAHLQSSSGDSGVSDENITVHFINRDGETLTATGKVGESFLDVVMKQNLDIDGFGACEGTLACSTCHLIFEPNVYDKIDPVTDEEMDMLDLAYGLTNTSRLGCQVCMKKSIDGLTVRVPTQVSDARQDAEVGQKRKQ